VFVSDALYWCSSRLKVYDVADSLASSWGRRKARGYGDNERFCPRCRLLHPAAFSCFTLSPDRFSAPDESAHRQTCGPPLHVFGKRSGCIWPAHNSTPEDLLPLIQKPVGMPLVRKDSGLDTAGGLAQENMSLSSPALVQHRCVQRWRSNTCRATYSSEVISTSALSFSYE